MVVQWIYKDSELGLHNGIYFAVTCHEMPGPLLDCCPVARYLKVARRTAAAREGPATGPLARTGLQVVGVRIAAWILANSIPLRYLPNS